LDCMIIRSCLYGTFIIALMSCMPIRSPNSSLMDVSATSVGYPTPGVCAAGQTGLTFEPVGEGLTVARSDIGLVGNIDTLWGQLEEGDQEGYRLDLCMDNTTSDVTLEHMVENQPNIDFNPHYINFTPDTVAPNPAWGPAIADGGSTDLEVKFMNQTTPAKSYVLKGWKTADGKSFVTVSNFDWNSGNTTAITSGRVTYGALRAGDPWLTTYHKNDRLIASGTLRIELRYSFKSDGNNYKSYKVNSVRVVDQNPALPSPVDTTLTGTVDSRQLC
jgi:hypothetical protein